MLKLTLAGLLFVVGSMQAETYVFCTDEADAVVTLQDGEYISNDLPSCTVVSPVRQIEAVSAIDLDTGDRVWKIKMLDTQEIGYLVRKGA